MRTHARTALLLCTLGALGVFLFPRFGWTSSPTASSFELRLGLAPWLEYTSTTETTVFAAGGWAETEASLLTCDLANVSFYSGLVAILLVIARRQVRVALRSTERARAPVTRLRISTSQLGLPWKAVIE